MKINIFVRACVLLLATAITTANAAALQCSGTVTELAYHSPGKLMLKLSSMNYGVIICSTDSDWTVAGTEYGSTSPSACKAIYSSFMIAKALGTTIDYVQFDGNDVPPTCNSFKPWTTVSVRYSRF